jgi:hypothetical protein
MVADGGPWRGLGPYACHWITPARYRLTPTTLRPIQTPSRTTCAHKAARAHLWSGAVCQPSAAQTIPATLKGIPRHGEKHHRGAATTKKMNAIRDVIGGGGDVEGGIGSSRWFGIQGSKAAEIPHNKGGNNEIPAARS